MKILILNSPNFQLLRSILKHKPVLTGSKAKIKRAIKSESKSNLAIKRCILLKLELAFVELSKANASRSKFTVWTLHSAIINRLISFMRDRLITPSNSTCKTSCNDVLLHPTLVFFMTREMSGFIPLRYGKSTSYAII